MTIDTKTHVEFFFLLHFDHFPYITVTCLASNPLGNVPFMIKKDEVCHVVHLDPFKRTSLLNQLLHFLNRGAILSHNEYQAKTPPKATTPIKDKGKRVFKRLDFNLMN